MPKIILNIEDRIFQSAKELFYEKGYEHVNMKEISKRADIAVGTLYNYFPNKNELYISVLENSWNITFEKLSKVSSKEIDEKEKLRTSIALIYEDVLNRKCMGVQIRKAKDLKGNKANKKIEKRIIDNLKGVFKGIKIKKQFKKDKNIMDKVVYTLLINLTMLIDYYPEDNTINIEYLYNSILGFFE